MPDLPTLTVTSTQAQRILAVFGTATEYKKWLRMQVIAAVIGAEGLADKTAMETDIPEPTV